MKKFFSIFAVVVFSAGFALAEDGAANASSGNDQSTVIEITGPAAEKMYNELTQPSRTDSYDAEGGIEVFIRVGKNIACTYATTVPAQYSCKIGLKDKTTGEVDLKY